MFFNKTIKELKERLKVLENNRFEIPTKRSIEDLYTRLWMLENRPLYKIGDKIEQFLVIDCVVDYESCTAIRVYKYFLFDEKTKTQTNMLERELINLKTKNKNK